MTTVTVPLSLLKQIARALKYHTEQTRPIARSSEALAELYKVLQKQEQTK